MTFQLFSNLIRHDPFFGLSVESKCDPSFRVGSAHRVVPTVEPNLSIGTNSARENSCGQEITDLLKIPLSVLHLCAVLPTISKQGGMFCRSTFCFGRILLSLNHSGDINPVLQLLKITTGAGFDPRLQNSMRTLDARVLLRVMWPIPNNFNTQTHQPQRQVWRQISTTAPRMSVINSQFLRPAPTAKNGTQSRLYRLRFDLLPDQQGGKHGNLKLLRWPHHSASTNSRRSDQPVSDATWHPSAKSHELVWPNPFLGAQSAGTADASPWLATNAVRFSGAAMACQDNAPAKGTGQNPRPTRDGAFSTTAPHGRSICHCAREDQLNSLGKLWHLDDHETCDTSFSRSKKTSSIAAQSRPVLPREDAKLLSALARSSKWEPASKHLLSRFDKARLNTLNALILNQLRGITECRIQGHNRTSPDRRLFSRLRAHGGRGRPRSQ